MKSKTLQQNTAIDISKDFTLPCDKSIPIDAEKILSATFDRLEQMSPDIRDTTDITVSCYDRGFLQYPDGTVEILPAQMQITATPIK